VLATHAVAAEHGVGAWLARECAASAPAFTDRTATVLPTVAGKAWRFAGEMEEDAAMLGACGLPRGFHDAAADVFERLAHLKGKPEGGVSLGEIVDAARTRPKKRPRSPAAGGDRNGAE
jgi:hypothetical protein